MYPYHIKVSLSNLHASAGMESSVSSVVAAQDCLTIVDPILRLTSQGQSQTHVAIDGPS
jgi:hypothetical protein